MTEIVLRDGKVLLVGGKVADGTACCCEVCACPECDAGISIELDGDPSTSSGCDGCLTCLNPPSYHARKSGQPYKGEELYNTHGGIDAVMYCEQNTAEKNGIIWRVAVTSVFANFFPSESTPLGGLYCLREYEGTVPMDANCLPVAGQVSGLVLVTTVDEGGCGELDQPTVTVKRL